MARTLFSAAVLVLLAGLISAARAQEKNELTGLIGRTFVSDHAAIDTSTPGALAHFGGRLERRSQLWAPAHGPGHCGADGRGAVRS